MTRLCPEGEYRDSLSDEDFWAHVFQTDYSDWTDFDNQNPNYPEWDLGNPCIICGSTGACGYDSEGRPLIHSEIRDDDDISDT